MEIIKWCIENIFNLKELIIILISIPIAIYFLFREFQYKKINKYLKINVNNPEKLTIKTIQVDTKINHKIILDHLNLLESKEIIQDLHLDNCIKFQFIRVFDKDML